MRNKYVRATDTTRSHGLRSYMLGVYQNMSLGLAITGAVALAFYSITALHYLISPGFILGSVVLQLVLVLSIPTIIDRASLITAHVLFWTYAALLGFNLSVLFFVYIAESIASTFFISASAFAALSIYGYTTKRDLTNFGSFLYAGLNALVIAVVINMFVGGSVMSFAISMIAVPIFLGLTAYQTQAIASHYYKFANDEKMRDKASILGALSLYLSFINIFIHLLRLIGDRK